MRPRRTRKDLNQTQVVEDLRKMGAIVWDLSDIGGKVLDLMVFWRGLSIPVEIKRPGLEHSLTEGEKEGMRELVSVGVYPLIAVSAEDIIRYMER